MSIFLPFGQEVSLAQRARSIPILMSLLYYNDTIIKKEKELLRALLIQFCKLEFSQFFISVFFLFQLINRPIVEITKINADVREKILSVGYLENVEVRVPVDFWPR